MQWYYASAKGIPQQDYGISGGVIDTIFGHNVVPSTVRTQPETKRTIVFAVPWKYGCSTRHAGGASVQKTNWGMGGGGGGIAIPIDGIVVQRGTTV